MACRGVGWIRSRFQVYTRVTRTTFVNETETLDFKIKEGIAGVFREVAFLAAGGEDGPHSKVTVTVKTERNYLLISPKTGKWTVIEADVCYDKEVVRIKTYGDGDFKLEYTVRAKDDISIDLGETEREIARQMHLEEIQSLLWIKGVEDMPQNRSIEALELWETKEKIFTLLIENSQRKLMDTRNQLYQIVIGFYVVLQGVLLVVVSQSNLFTCKKSWLAVDMSTLVSVVTGVAILLKFKTIIDVKDAIDDHQRRRMALLRWQLDLKREGEKFDFGKAQINFVKPKRAWWQKFSLVAVVSFFVLVLFSVEFVVLFRQILCKNII